MPFYEIRQYIIRPGKMEEWLKFMQEEVFPFMVAKGMIISGSFRGEEDDSVYVFLRRFESEADRERLYQAVYETDHWRNNIRPTVRALMDRDAMNIQRIIPTPVSTMQ
jgi:NIPSNAP